MAPRKYKERKGYYQGGRVLADTAIPDSDAAPEPQAEPAAEVVHGDDALVRAAEATRRAEELQRAPQPTIADYIEALPISDHKKDFLRQWPQMLQPERAAVMHRHHQAAMAAGIQDDTEDMDKFLLDAVNRDLRNQYRRGTEDALAATPLATATMATVPNLSSDEWLDKINNEVEGIRTTTAILENASLTDIAANLPEAPKPRPRVPFSAPVSREAPMSSGQRQSGNNSVTLSAEERDIARKSFTDPKMSDLEKELLYARNKQRLAKMRAAGSYPMPEKN